MPTLASRNNLSENNSEQFSPTSLVYGIQGVYFVIAQGTQAYKVKAFTESIAQTIQTSNAPSIVEISQKYQSKSFDKYKETFLVDLEQALMLQELDESPSEFAKDILFDALLKFTPYSIEWIADFFFQHLKDEPSITASLLKCLGHFDIKLVSPFGYYLAFEGLKAKSQKVRFGAILALERWRGDKARELLQSHVKNETSKLLQGYIKRVLAHLPKEN
jgi:hypothetical protein